MNKTTKDNLMRYVLTPLSWAYGACTWVRNKMFDDGMLKEESFSIPVIGVGNLTVGGTGKTPHVEYIVDHFCRKYNVAVLSRGYKRKTKGFVLANPQSTPDIIGDEPMQIFQKFGHKAKVAVCEKRGEGIRELQRLFPDLQLIILDDAFQHRYVKPKVSILLMDSHRPFYADRLLPLGRLRESSRQADRADVVIVTKCPEDLPPIEANVISKKLDLMGFQKLFFSKYTYSPLEPVFPEDAPFSVDINRLESRDSVLLLTGVANPRSFVRHFKNYPFRIKIDHFPDHHDFSRHDINEITKKFKTMKGEHKLIVTTEKDAVRLAFNPYYPKELKPYTYFLPLKVQMVDYPSASGDFLTILENLIEQKEG